MLEHFYGDTLPDAGYYCITLLPAGKHIWAETLDELTHITLQHQDRQGVYFGTAAYQSVANRKQTNVLSLKALRLDIDAGPEKLAKHGPDKVYATQRDALAASVAFFKTTGLMPTYIVSSGAGLHLYYCLDVSIDPVAWLRLAKGLSRLSAEQRLKVDPSVTEDSARVLRPIGALHPNGSRVQVLKFTSRFYTEAELAAALLVEAPLAPTRKYDTSINDDIDAAYQGPPSSALKVAEHCGALREVAASRGDVPEPFWRAMLGLVKRTVEGIDIAQEWSSGHDSYDPAQVERKFDAWSTGPTTCAEFAKHSPACATCPYAGKVKSPINLGLMTAPEVEQLPEEMQPLPPTPAPLTGDAWDGCIPPGFDVLTTPAGKKLLVYSMTVDKESETGEVVQVRIKVPVSNEIFWFGQWAEAAHSEDTAQVTLHLWTGTHVKNYMMDQTLIASTSKLLEFLAGKSIHTTTHKRAPQAMTDFAKGSLERMRLAHQLPKIADHLGLRILEDCALVAAHGKHVIYPDGSIKQAMLGGTLISIAEHFPIPLPVSYTSCWDASVWETHIMPRAQQHVEFLRRYYGAPGMERFQLAIMLGLASPLLAFVTASFHAGSTLPGLGLSVSLYSRESARGKTTAVSSAILAYGNPAGLTKDAGKYGTTDNARISRLSAHGTMPSVMDEMGGASAASVAQMVSAVGNGAGRVRATRSGAVVESATWALINLITTNTSQRDMISAVDDTTGAIQYRLLEINVEDVPEYNQELRTSFTEDWSKINRECPGALGAVIHREICAMGVALVSKTVIDCCAQASAIVQADQSARFQYRGLGAMLALQLILKRLKLDPFPMEGMVAQFRIAHDAGRDHVVENVLPKDGLELLSRALQDIAPHIIVTDGETHRAANTAKFDTVLNARIPDTIKGRHIQSTRHTYLDVRALREWALEHGISERPIVAEGQRRGIIKTRHSPGSPAQRSSSKITLTKGLRDTMELQCSCYTIDMARLQAALGGDNTVLTGGRVVPLSRGLPPVITPEEAQELQGGMGA